LKLQGDVAAQSQKECAMLKECVEFIIKKEKKRKKRKEKKKYFLKVVMKREKVD